MPTFKQAQMDAYNEGIRIGYERGLKRAEERYYKELAMKEIVIKLHKSGMPNATIAQMLEYDPDNVDRWLQEEAQSSNT